MKVTIEDIIKELERELKMRKSVYPKMILDGKLHRHQANKQYLCVQEAIRILPEKNEEKTSVQKELF